MRIAIKYIDGSVDYTDITDEYEGEYSFFNLKEDLRSSGGFGFICVPICGVNSRINLNNVLWVRDVEEDEKQYAEHMAFLHRGFEAGIVSKPVVSGGQDNAEVSVEDVRPMDQINANLPRVSDS